MLGMRDRSEEPMLVEWLRQIPDFSPDSPIGRTFVHYNQANSAQAVGDWWKAAGTPMPSATTDDERLAKAAARKVANALKKANAEKKKQAATAVAQAVGNTAGIPINLGLIDRRKTKLVCIPFNSEVGCKFGDQCRFSHIVPGRQSTDWKMVHQALTDRKHVPSAVFLAAK